jgi:hypothetical protein
MIGYGSLLSSTDSEDGKIEQAPANARIIIARNRT